jgi:YHS domain-containing protein
VDAVIHSSVFLLVDAQGVVRGAFDSEVAADFAAREQGVRTLAVLPPAAPGPDLPPEELYHALACANCHERPELAPPLFGRAGSSRELDSSLRVPFDDAYVRESLIAPEAKRARGYPLKMPSYQGLLSAPQLDALSRWILSRPAVGEAAPEAEVAVDPICQMKVRVTADALSAEVAGKRHYFCAESCRRAFLAESAGGSGQPGGPAGH